MCDQIVEKTLESDAEDRQDTLIHPQAVSQQAHPSG